MTTSEMHAAFKSLAARVAMLESNLAGTVENMKALSDALATNLDVMRKLTEIVTELGPHRVAAKIRKIDGGGEPPLMS
jgi:hypothetical protein